jgi:hypothetical protein
MQFKLGIVIALLAGALAGCGGGTSGDQVQVGGGNPPPPPPPPGDSTEAVFTAGANNQEIDPQLDPATGQPTGASPALQGAAFTFSASSPDLEGAAYDLPAGLATDFGGTFAPASYAGAFSQDNPVNWTEGWTVSLNGNVTVWQPVGAPAAGGTCPAGTTPDGTQALPAAVGGGTMDVCRLASRYATDGQTITLTADNIYRLSQGFPGTYIGNGECEIGGVGCAATANDVANVALVIEAGTLILGDASEALIVTRGSTIDANGTAADPVVMTSVDQFVAWVAGGDGDSGRGEWAGLALMGFGATNECVGVPCNVNAEGNIGFYGGENDNDDSGDLDYVVILHAGNDIDGNGNELNGLTFFGTGAGTTASYVQVHKGLDDGIEHFGATDFIDHVVLTDNADDSFDWGQGYRGGAQFVVIKQATDAGDKGIEADNDEGANDALPRSKPVLANFTILGRRDGQAAADGIILRRGTGALIHNFVVADFRDSCLDVDETATQNLFGTDLTISGSILWCSDGDEFENDANQAATAAWFNAGTNNRVVDPNLSGIGIPNPVTGVEGDFESTNFTGAYSQDPLDDWTAGWTVSLAGNNTVWEPATGGTLAGAVPAANDLCPAGTTDVGDADLSSLGGGGMDICQLAARYGSAGTTTLTNDNVYRIASGFPGTYVGNGECEIGSATCAAGAVVAARLVIEPGTLILGDAAEALIVTRGSRIEANGTALDPIVMTSVDQFTAWAAGGDGDSGRGEWAGLALMGYAKSNECTGVPCNVNAEGNIGFYGGENDADDSGFLRYVVIQHAGNDIDGNGNELNGLTFFATGSATIASHVQVHKGLDDGVEHFGGKSFIDHVVLTANADDSLDWGQGWRGGAQYVVIVQAADDADAGIEADNDENDNNAEPVSVPTLVNLTIVGSDGGTPATADTRGILLRRGTGAKIYNTIVTGSDTCLRIQGDATFARVDDGRLFFENSIVSCTTNFAD